MQTHPSLYLQTGEGRRSNATIYKLPKLDELFKYLQTSEGRRSNNNFPQPQLIRTWTNLKAC